jgi:SAM-dependent methyltransferase
VSDIFAGQATDAASLAELYDLEHDEVDDDLPFWRELVRRQPGAVLDVGCGSGRLFRTLLAAGAGPLVGLDGSVTLLERGRGRIAGDPLLRQAADEARLVLAAGDARQPLPQAAMAAAPYELIALAGMVPHLEGLDELTAVLRHLAPAVGREGRIVLDDLGPAQLPHRNLPLSVDWQRDREGQRFVRRSRLERWEEADGVRVAYATITERRDPDGTIGSLPASFRLWYPSVISIERAAAEAGLLVDLIWGSYELDSYDPTDSERRIAVIRPAGTNMPGRSRS